MFNSSIILLGLSNLKKSIETHVSKLAFMQTEPGKYYQLKGQLYL